MAQFPVQYSIIVPVYNSAQTLTELFDRIQQVFSQHLSASYEVVFVNDGSQDHSLTVLQSLQAANKEIVKCIPLTRNFGQHNALLCGIEYASGSFILTIDDDLQFEPEDMLHLVAMQKEGDYDIVYGKYPRDNHVFFRNLTSKILHTVIHYAIPDLHKDVSSFRIIKSEIAKHCLGMRNSQPFIDGYMSWVTQHTASIAVRGNKRTSGKSGYNFWKLLAFTSSIIFTFTRLPIQLLNYLSLLTYLSTLGYTLYIFFRQLIFHDMLMGFPSLIVFIGFTSGTLLLGIRILSEYIFNIYQNMVNKTSFLVKKEG